MCWNLSIVLELLGEPCYPYSYVVSKPPTTLLYDVNFRKPFDIDLFVYITNSRL